MRQNAKRRYAKKPWTKDQYSAWQEFIQDNNVKLMSVWDKEELNQEDNSNSKFLNKLLGDGDSIKLQFVDVQHEDQREETPDVYKTPDGKEWVLYFVDEAGNEKTMVQKTARGRLITALRQSKIEPNDWVTVTRTGVELETDYAVIKLAGKDDVASVSESAESTPF